MHGYVIASKMVMTDKLPPKRVYREEPDEEGDTGWRIFSGLEDEKYMNEPSNFGIYDIANIAMLDESLKDILSSPAGTEYIKSAEEKGWKKI